MEVMGNLRRIYSGQDNGVPVVMTERPRIKKLVHVNGGHKQQRDERFVSESFRMGSQWWGVEG